MIAASGTRFDGLDLLVILALVASLFALGYWLNRERRQDVWRDPLPFSLLADYTDKHPSTRGSISVVLSDTIFTDHTKSAPKPYDWNEEFPVAK